MTDVLSTSRMFKLSKLPSRNEHIPTTPELKTLFDGQFRVGSSSRELNWDSILVERQVLEPCEMPERRADRYFLALWCTCGIGEHANGRGLRRPFIKPAGALTFVPSGIVPAARTENRNELICCSLDSKFVEAVMDEMEHRPADLSSVRTGFTDLSIRRLLELLMDEAHRGGQAGLLYVDHLAHALAARISSLGGAKPDRLLTKSAPLPQAAIRRVVEYMHSSEKNIDLQSLAKESGYSRGHFLRRFQTSTGLTPHRYLMKIRLERAQELMKEKSRSLIDIALSCGFASHSHMSRIFRQTVGVTPSEYRRQL